MSFPPPLPVAWQIAENVRDKIAAIDIPGTSVGLTLIADAGADVSARPDDHLSRICAEVKAGKIAIEMYLGDDVPIDETGQGSNVGVDEWATPVVLYCHLPEKTSDTAEPAQLVARRLTSAVQALVSPTSENAGQWDGLAVRSIFKLGGGVFVDGGPGGAGTRVTVIAFEVEWRSVSGDMNLAA